MRKSVIIESKDVEYKIIIDTDKIIIDGKDSNDENLIIDVADITMFGDINSKFRICLRNKKRIKTIDVVCEDRKKYQILLRKFASDQMRREKETNLE